MAIGKHTTTSIIKSMLGAQSSRRLAWRRLAWRQRQRLGLVVLTTTPAAPFESCCIVAFWSGYRIQGVIPCAVLPFHTDPGTQLVRSISTSIGLTFIRGDNKVTQNNNNKHSWREVVWCHFTVLCGYVYLRSWLHIHILVSLRKEALYQPWHVTP